MENRTGKKRKQAHDHMIQIYTGNFGTDMWQVLQKWFTKPHVCVYL